MQIAGIQRFGKKAGKGTCDKNRDLNCKKESSRSQNRDTFGSSALTLESYHSLWNPSDEKPHHSVQYCIVDLVLPGWGFGIMLLTLGIT